MCSRFSAARDPARPSISQTAPAFRAIGRRCGKAKRNGGEWAAELFGRRRVFCFRPSRPRPPETTRMSAVEIVPLSSDKMRPAVRCSNGCFRGAHYAFPFTAKLIRQRMSHPGWEKLALVALADGTAVAFVSACRRADGVRSGPAGDGDTAYISLLWVLPAYRMRGIGRLMVGRAAEWARANGADKLAVDFHGLSFWPGVDGAWVEAQAFFERIGFRIGKIYASAVADLTAYSMPERILGREGELRREGIEVRVFRPADRTSLLRFALAAFGPDAHEEARCHLERTRWGFTRFGMDWARLVEPQMIAVAVDGSRVVGYALCSSRLRRNAGALEFVCVGGNMRSRGIGGALIARGLDALRAAGLSCAEIWTDCDSPLLRWCCSTFRFRIHRKWLAYEMPLR